MDAVLLSDYAGIKKDGRVMDLCSGTGIVPILLEAKYEAKYIEGLEYQEDCVDMARRSVSMNGLEGKIRMSAGDVREVKEHYLFTDPIILNRQVLVQRTAEANQGIKPIRNQLHLGKKELYLPKNSPALLRIRNLEHEIGDTIYIHEDELYSDEQLIILVAKGDIDYAVCNQQNAEQLLSQYPEIDIQTDISFTQLESWVMRNDSPILRDSLNHWLERLKANGTYKKIYNQYYNQK